MQRQQDAIPWGLTLHPTEQEFADFRKYINKVASSPACLKRGFVKIIPPRSFLKESVWKPDALDQIEVSKPIEQQVCVRNGFNELCLMTRKSLSLREYKKIVDADFAGCPLTNKSASEEYEKYVG